MGDVGLALASLLFGAVLGHFSARIWLAKRIEHRLSCAEAGLAKLGTLPLEWETVLGKLTKLAGRVDKQAALLRSPEKEETEPPPEPEPKPEPTPARPVSRLELLAVRR